MTQDATALAQHTVIIVGGGTGGMAVAARLRRNAPALDIVIVDPAVHHDYQPAWTLVGAGSYAAAATRRLLNDCLPQGVKRVARHVVQFLPELQQIQLDDGQRLAYQYLVVAAGIELQWDAIEGLSDTLGSNGVTSNYRYELAPYTWELTRQFRGGTAIFTQPAGAVKCPGAPQKALYLAADHFRRRGLQDVNLQFRSGAASIFGVPFFAQALDTVLQSYHAHAHYGQRLVAVRGAEKIAVFESLQHEIPVREEVPFDLLHVVPPQAAPAFIRNSPLADAHGWLEVDGQTLQHVRYPAIYGLGDCISTSNSKTAAAIRSQAPVVCSNLLAALKQSEAQAHYDGYAACPITTARGRVMLAEFTYGGTVTPSFPLDPRVPRRIYWWLKQRFLPWFYWHVLIQGRGLPVTHRVRSFPDPLPQSAAIDAQQISPQEV